MEADVGFDVFDGKARCSKLQRESNLTYDLDRLLSNASRVRVVREGSMDHCTTEANPVS